MKKKEPKSKLPKDIVTAVEISEKGARHNYHSYVENSLRPDLLERVRNVDGGKATHVAIWTLKEIRPIVRTPTYIGPPISI